MKILRERVIVRSRTEAQGGAQRQRGAELDELQHAHGGSEAAEHAQGHRGAWRKNKKQIEI